MKTSAATVTAFHVTTTSFFLVYYWNYLFPMTMNSSAVDCARTRRDPLHSRLVFLHHQTVRRSNGVGRLRAWMRLSLHPWHHHVLLGLWGGVLQRRADSPSRKTCSQGRRAYWKTNIMCLGLQAPATRNLSFKKRTFCRNLSFKKRAFHNGGADQSVVIQPCPEAGISWFRLDCRRMS